MVKQYIHSYSLLHKVTTTDFTEHINNFYTKLIYDNFLACGGQIPHVSSKVLSVAGLDIPV